MRHQIRDLVAALLIAAVCGVSASAAGKATTSQPVPGEDEYRSAVGYHAAVMEHCKEINGLARARGSFNVALAREHAAEVSRNLGSASKHMTDYLAALNAEQKGHVDAQSTVAASKQGESERLAAALGDALDGAAPDRKLVVSTITQLYLAERDLVTAEKVAGKAL